MSKRKFRLRIFQDHLTEGSAAALSKTNRIIYCVAGQAILTVGDQNQELADDVARFADVECTIRGEGEGARLWRWELVTAAESPSEIRATGIKSVNAGDFEIELDTSVKRLMRIDQVSFPLGGEALMHVHAAPGVRCLLKGNLLVESLGHRLRFWPGDSWVEHGPDPVYAKASDREPTSFVRVMIIPEEFRGRSTITYVRPEDKDKPKSQSYTRYLEKPIAL